MNDAVLEADAIDERLQRRARRAQAFGHVHLAGALVVEIIGRADPRQHFAARIVDREDRDRDIRARALAPARAPALRDLPAIPHRSSAGPAGDPPRRRPHRRLRAAHAPASACARSAPAPPWRQRSRPRRRCRPAPPGRERGRGRAAPPRPTRSGRRASGDCGKRHQQRRLAEREPPRLLAEIGERGGANAFEIAAIGRETEIQREHLVLGQAALDLDRRARSGAALPQKTAPLRGSSRRATCMVSVEPPDTIRPWQQLRTAAQQARNGSTPGARESVCPRRRSAVARSADRRRPPAPASRQRPSPSHRRAAAGRRDRPRGSKIAARRRAAAARAQRSTTRRCQAAQRREAQRRWRRRAGLSIAGSFRRGHLHAFGRGAAVAVGRVHVLHIGLRQHICAGRHRAHHIGDGKHRGRRGVLRSNAAVKRSSRNSELTGSCAFSIQPSVPVSPDETRRGLSISNPAGR